MWQANERKARFIAAALSGDRTVRTIDDIGEAANQFALAKAIASGDARLMQKAGLEGEIARLDRQRAAHFDDQLNVRRQIQRARHDHAVAERRIAAIRQDLARRIPTRGDAFAMTLEGRTFSERRAAGALLLSKVRLVQRAGQDAEFELGEIGGFPLLCSARKAWLRPFEAGLVLRRTDYEQDIQVGADLTAAGLIARLEHILDHFELDLQEQERRARDAAQRVTDYETRLGQPFPLQAELDAKLHQLAVLEADLAQTGKAAASTAPLTAPLF